MGRPTAGDDAQSWMNSPKAVLGTAFTGRYEDDYDIYVKVWFRLSTASTWTDSYDFNVAGDPHSSITITSNDGYGNLSSQASNCSHWHPGAPPAEPAPRRRGVLASRAAAWLLGGHPALYLAILVLTPIGYAIASYSDARERRRALACQQLERVPHAA